MSTIPSFHVAFNLNEGGIPGLGSALASMISSCSSPDALSIHILGSNLGLVHKNNVKDLLDSMSYGGRFEFIDYNADEVFKGLPALLGDLTIYGRLLIPEMIDEPRVLYLDSDVVLTCNVLELRDVNLEEHILAAVADRPVSDTPDFPYFRDRGFPSEMMYFNSGVLLINSETWRRKNVAATWREILKDRPDSLPSHDQSVLNRICGGDYKRLDPKFNTLFYPDVKPQNTQDAILHFAGSPKPWDISGRMLHNGYSIWKRYCPEKWKRSYLTLNSNKLIRFWHIRRSAIRYMIEYYKRF